MNGVANISDVGYMSRFAGCNEWFKWIISEIKIGAVNEYRVPESLEKYRSIATDMSIVTTKGAVKQTYHLHYAIDIFNLTSTQYKLTDIKTGESLTNFDVAENDLMIGDRGYGKKKGIEHCLNSGGHFIFRLKNKGFKLYDENRAEINILSFLNDVTTKEASEVQVYMESSKKDLIALRLCAIKKSDENIEKSNKRLHRKESRTLCKISPETKKTHEYIFVLTSLPSDVTASEILEAYRYRWQVELYFKRLKSIMDFGDIPKKKDTGVVTWLNGKLMVALLIEMIISEADFSPSVTE
jgi:hypothetical protein